MKLNNKIKKIYLNLIILIYGAWNETEPHLYEFNKTIITLSSSILVLSFSVIQFSKSTVDKNIMGISWILLVLALIIGVILYFVRFIVAFSVEKVKETRGVTNNNFFEHKECVVYSILISISFILGFTQLILFAAGVIILMISAFNSL